MLTYHNSTPCSFVHRLKMAGKHCKLVLIQIILAQGPAQDVSDLMKHSHETIIVI